MYVCMYVGFTVDDLVRMQLPIKLPPGTVLDIYRKFRSICDCLAESASVTHQVCHTYIHYTIRPPCTSYHTYIHTYIHRSYCRWLPSTRTRQAPWTIVLT